MLSLICAMGRKNEIGLKNKMLWHLPKDLQYFKNTTGNFPVVMGRKTHDSIGKALPNRTNMVVSRNTDWLVEGVLVVNTLKEALKHTRKISDEVFVIGGQTIYEQCLPLADKLYLTRVDAELTADRFFPEWNEKDWELTREECHEKDEKHAYDYCFQIWERKK